MVALGCMAAEGAAAARVAFTRDIRPLLSDKCFACHGPDIQKVKGGLRLDLRESALRPAKSGRSAIVPGDPSASGLVQRIETSDEDDVMPPPQSHKVLSTLERDLLKRWVAEGAEYEVHWAYARPVKPAVPSGARGVDDLVRRRLREVGLDPAPGADRRTLVRRLSQDLLGLPATPAEVEAFERDAAPDAYERLVDRFLASPHHGERMAVTRTGNARMRAASSWGGIRTTGSLRDRGVGGWRRNLCGTRRWRWRGCWSRWWGVPVSGPTSLRVTGRT
jgi:hypothetical protein